MDFDNVKSLTADLYDWYQLRVMDCAGNNYWHEFAKEYGFHELPIDKKYARDEAKWYRRRLARTAMGQPFTEVAPPHNTNEQVE